MSGSAFGTTTSVGSLTSTTGITLSAVSGSTANLSAVAGVGDVNGDGFDDFVVGAFNANGQTGFATLVFGKASGWTDLQVPTAAAPATIDFTTSTPGFARLGNAVRGLGDINGDGLSDLLITSPFAGPSAAGISYVVFGKTSGWADVNVTTLTGGTSGGFQIIGPTASLALGTQATQNLGDVNGDGFADIMLMSNFTSGTIFAYIVFGKAGGTNNVNWSNIDLSTTPPTSTAIRIDGPGSSGSFVTTSGSAGDLNGDGYADFAWGHNTVTVGGATSAGQLFVRFGGPSLGNVDFNNPIAAGDGFVISGVSANDRVGWNVASAGDVNGDGITDLLVGGNGKAWLIFGRTGSWSDISVGSLTPDVGVVLTSAAFNFGRLVRGIGDANGDGFDDFAIAADQATVSGNTGAGQIFIVYGKASGWANQNLDTQTDNVSLVQGSAFNQRLSLNLNLNGLGDVDGDGFTDFGVGAPLANSGDGGVYALFSQSTGNIRGTGTTVADSIRGGDGNDSLFGYGANDTLLGGAGDDTVEGGAGNDMLNGGAGNDTLSYANATAGVTVNLFVTTGQNTGGAGVDTATGFENLLGSAFNDTLSASGTNTIEGGGGNDNLNGGGAGGTASYAGASAGVTVSLALQGSAQNTVAAGTDTLNNFTSLLGSAFNDTLTGDSSANTLTGGLGNDVMSGAAGNDRLFGGEGIDTAIIAGTRAANPFSKAIGPGWSVGAVYPNPASDFLTSVERIQYDDQVVNIGFARTEDMAGRGYGDILYQNVSGGWLYRWQMQGTNRTAEGALAGPGENWVIVGKGDFNADLNADILWRNTTTGELYAWLMNGASKLGEGSVGALAAGQSVGGIGDTDGDGKADIVLRGSDGAWAVQRMNGTSVVSTAGGTLDATWSVAAVSDFNGDLRADLLWRNSSTGQLYLWRMDGSTVSAQNSYATPGSAFVVAGTGDLNGDGRADVVIKHATQNWFWGYLTNTSAAAGSSGWLGGEGSGYVLQKVADYTGDDMADLLFYDAANGFAWLQAQNGLTLASSGGAGVAGAGFALL